MHDYVKDITGDQIYDLDSSGIASGLVNVMASKVEVDGIKLNNSVSSFGIFKASDNTELLVQNSEFDTLIGIDYSAFLFSTQNTKGIVRILNNTVKNSVSSSGLMTLVFSKVDIDQCTFLNNHAKQSTNGL